jgi:hypothetical protein
VADGNFQIRAGGAAAGAAVANAPGRGTGESRPVLPPGLEPVFLALMLQPGLGVLCGGDDWLGRLSPPPCARGTPIVARLCLWFALKSFIIKSLWQALMNAMIR